MEPSEGMDAPASPPVITRAHSGAPLGAADERRGGGGEEHGHRAQHPALPVPVGEPGRQRRAGRVADRARRGHDPGQPVPAGDRRDQQDRAQAEHGHRHPADEARGGEPQRARPGEHVEERVAAPLVLLPDLRHDLGNLRL
jgi:hypothetical protein